MFCLLINPGSDDLTDCGPPVLGSRLQHPVVVVGGEDGGEESLVLVFVSRDPVLGPQSDLLVLRHLIGSRPFLQQSGLFKGFFLLDLLGLEVLS